MSRESRPQDVTVVTWNIEHGVKIAEALEALTQTASLRDADVLLLQEMDDEGTAAIADALGLDHVYVCGEPHSKTGRNFGNAILAKGSLTSPTIVELPHRAALLGERRIAVHATATIDGREISLWSVHAEVPTLRFVKQVEQYAAVAAAVDADLQPCLVLGGDFNTASARSVRALERQVHAARGERISACAGATLRRFGRDFTLDHLFARGLTKVRGGVERGHHASDHDPVWATLRSPD